MGDSLRGVHSFKGVPYYTVLLHCLIIIQYSSTVYRDHGG